MLALFVPEKKKEEDGKAGQAQPEINVPTTEFAHGEERTYSGQHQQEGNFARGKTFLVSHSRRAPHSPERKS
jgi:hypothetical protein